MDLSWRNKLKHSIARTWRKNCACFRMPSSMRTEDRWRVPQLSLNTPRERLGNLASARTRYYMKSVSCKIREVSWNSNWYIIVLFLASQSGYDECYKCQRSGHWARDCPSERPSGGGRDRRRSSPRRRFVALSLHMKHFELLILISCSVAFIVQISTATTSLSHALEVSWSASSSFEQPLPRSTSSFKVAHARASPERKQIAAPATTEHQSFARQRQRCVKVVCSSRSQRLTLNECFIFLIGNQ